MNTTPRRGDWMRIGLVSCGKMKAADPAPARHLYQSELFQLSLAYAEATCDRVFLLSAKHGVIHPDEQLKPYEFTIDKLTAVERLLWASDAIRKVRDVASPDPATLVLFAGESYVRPLRAYAGEELVIEEPLQGLFIGKRLQWLRQAPIARQAA